MLSHNKLRVVFIAWSKQWIFNVRIRLSHPLLWGLYFPDNFLQTGSINLLAMDSWLSCPEFLLFVKESSGLGDFCENQRPMVREA